MAFGPGKYDNECTTAREATGARSAILLVIDGKLGTGFSAQMTTNDLAYIPAMLRHMADEIEAGRG